MREGLRSGKALAKSVPLELEINDVFRNGAEGLCLVSSSLGYKEESLSRGSEKTVTQRVKKDCASDMEFASDNCVHSSVHKKGRKNSSRGNGCLQNDNKEKQEHLSVEVQFSGRVLRSRSKCNLPSGEDEAMSLPKESGDILVSKRKMKAEKEDDDFVVVGVDNNKIRLNVENINALGTDGGLTDKSKRGRKQGKSAALNMEEPNQFANTVNHQSSGKCQLSSNTKGSNGLVKVVSREKVIQNRRKFSNMEVNLKNNAPSDSKRTQTVYSGSHKDSKVKSSSSAKKVSSSEGDKQKRSTRKQLLREKIAEMLFTAGWKVDYRPRNNKDYNDAVYVSLDGKTHWSITLAYRRLKQHYEAGDGEDKAYKSGFKFTPIPEEEFNTLTKVMLKKRKGKKNTEKKAEKDGGKQKFVFKVKPGSDPCPGKPGKGKNKRKITEQDHSIMRDRKRQKSQNRKRCTILVRNAEKKVESGKDGYTPYDGKRTLLTWMIDSGSVPLNCSVLYINPRKQRVLRQGRITRDGIHCDCCNEIVSISEFEAHARSKLFEPLENIYLERGTSLLNCMLESWNKQDESERKSFHYIDINTEDPNDDTCGICGDGGDLVCCDSCPSTFHQSCLDIKNFPSGDWNCCYCCCKFCGLVGGSTHERKDDGDIAMSALMSCRLCEEKYHKSCFKAEDAAMEILHDLGFCGDKCQELFKRLEMLLGVKHAMEDGFSWTLVRRSDVFSDSKMKTEVIESNSKLAVALLIMDECFLPIIDHRSGTNMIHNVIYNRGSNFNRLNYSGFFTAILERGDEIISAASLRLRGNQLAEMPFIGTRYLYRRQGMCRRLLCGIESALCMLNVELLVIPAVSELRDTWTTAFGFVPLEVTNQSKIKNKNFLVFPGVDMLQKRITSLSNGESKDCQLGDCHTFGGMSNSFDQSSNFKVSNEVPPSGCEIKSGLQLDDDGLNNVANPEAYKVEQGCLSGPGFKVSGEFCDPQRSEMNDLAVSVEPVSLVLSGCLTDVVNTESNSLKQGCSSALEPKVPEISKIIEFGISDLAISGPQLAYVSINDAPDHQNENICLIKPDSVLSDLESAINVAQRKDTPSFVHQIANSCCELQSEDEKVTDIGSQCNKYRTSVKESKLLYEKRDGVVENDVNSCLDSTEHIGQNIAVQMANHEEEFKPPVDNISHDLECGNQPSCAAAHVVDPDSRDLPRIGCASDLPVPINGECITNLLPVEPLSLESTLECGEPTICCSPQFSPSAGVSSEVVLLTGNSCNPRAVDIVDGLSFDYDGESFGDGNVECDHKANVRDTKVPSQRTGINGEVCHSARVGS